MTATDTPVVGHPAKYSQPILDKIADLAADWSGLILDPFAGTGRIHELNRDDTVGVEIEREWADQHQRTLHGNSRDLAALLADQQMPPIRAICTSPAYGNRMADAYDGRDGSKRHTYRIDLGRPLSADNGAGMHWHQDTYRELHAAVWWQCWIVLKPGGVFALNVSDFMKLKERQPVTQWHLQTLLSIGFRFEEGHTIDTRRNGQGSLKSRDQRVDGEQLLIFRKPTN